MVDEAGEGRRERPPRAQSSVLGGREVDQEIARPSEIEIRLIVGEHMNTAIIDSTKEEVNILCRRPFTTHHPYCYSFYALYVPLSGAYNMLLYTILQATIDVGLDLVREVQVREGEAATTGDGQDQDLDQDHAPQHIEGGSVYMLNIIIYMEQL